MTPPQHERWEGASLITLDGLRDTPEKVGGVCYLSRHQCHSVFLQFLLIIDDSLSRCVHIPTGVDVFILVSTHTLFSKCLSELESGKKTDASSACELEHSHLAFAGEENSSVTVGHLQFGSFPCFDGHVPQLYVASALTTFLRELRFGYAFGSFKLAGDDPDSTGIVGESYRGNFAGHNRLIARFDHLQTSRKVDPQLAHFEGSTRFCKLARVELLVEDARPGRHPLHVPRADNTAISF